MRSFYHNFFKETPFPACFLKKAKDGQDYVIVKRNECFKRQISAQTELSFFDVVDLNRTDFAKFLSCKKQFLYEAECFLPNKRKVGLSCVESANGQEYICYFFPREQEDVESKPQENTLGYLTGGIAHDFNNILSIIIGYTQAIKENCADEQQLAGLEKVICAAQKGASLTRQLLAFSKQKLMLDQHEDINVSIEEQISLMHKILGPNIQTEFAKSKQPLIIKTAPDVIGQIMLNLLINARDAINSQPKGTGKINVRVSHVPLPQDRKLFPHGAAQIRVSDTGGGMKDAILAKAFDPFFTTKEQGKGTGLGLSTVNGLISQLGGRIKVCSDTVGTVFYIELPLTRPVQEVQKLDVIIKAKHLKNKTILIAEDENDLAYLMHGSLTRIGMNVLMADTGKKALEILEHHEEPIDFLLTDIVMPEMHGMYLGGLFAQKSPKTDIIYMSGYPDRSSFSQPIDVPEGCHILAKPIQIETIIYLMEQISCGAKENEIERIYKSLNRCL